MVEPCDEAERLVLALPSLQLSQDQRPEDLHILRRKTCSHLSTVPLLKKYTSGQKRIEVITFFF